LNISYEVKSLYIHIVLVLSILYFPQHIPHPILLFSINDVHSYILQANRNSKYILLLTYSVLLASLLLDTIVLL